MKRILTLLLALGGVLYGNAQVTDSVNVKKKQAKIEIGSEGVSIQVGEIDSGKIEKKAKYPRFNFGFNLEHFDIGLSKYHNGDNFSFPDDYRFLDHENWKTHTVGFDVLQFGVRFNPNFKIMLAAGIDWNHIRLKRKDITILADSPVLNYTEDPNSNLKKNRFSNRYLRVPLYFEYRSNQTKDSKRFSLVAGPEVGFLIDGKLKQKSQNGEKTKVKDDFNFEKFRYGANLRLGYGAAGLFFKYYFNDVFAKNEAPGLEDYKNMSFGLTFGF